MSRRLSGFTLIEVLVALAIVAIGMAAVLQALSASSNTVLYLRDKMLAQWVGLNQVATVRLGLQPGQIPPVGNTTGDLDYAGRSWHWRQEVTALQVQGLVRIDVSVRPAEIKAGDDNGWFTTVSGVAGDALAPAQGSTPTWGTGGLPGQSSNCQPGQLGCNPQQTCPPGSPQGTAGCQAQPQCQAGSLGCNNTQPAPCAPGSLGCSPNQSPTTPINPGEPAPGNPTDPGTSGSNTGGDTTGKSTAPPGGDFGGQK
jgi:general secretion pathway protein I